MNDLFDQRLRNAAQSLPAPLAPDALIARVIAERASGSRIILPVDARRSAYGRVRALALFAVAATIVIAALLATPRSGARSTPPTDVDSVSSLEQFFVSSGMIPSAAYAQTPPAAPGAPPLGGINGLMAGGRKLQFRIQSIDAAGHATTEGEGNVQIVEATYDGAPAWRVDAVRRFVADGGQRRVEGETLYVARNDLRPLARVVHQAPSSRLSEITIRQRFIGDSVVGEMTSDHGIHRAIARALPATFGPYLSDALAPVALIGIHLSPTWRASLSIIGWAVVPGDVFFPVTLRVIGEERLALASGTFDCWKVHISAGAEQRTEWVRKSDGIALRSMQDPSPSASARREYLLLDP
jgi:hypothetical protein